MRDRTEFEWDELKFRTNIEKHGIDFRDAVAVFNGYRATWSSDRHGERRWCTVGMMRNVEVAVFYTMRGDVTRIFSARRASVNERERYYSYLSEGGA